MSYDIFNIIREKVDIADVVARYVSLKPTGNYLKGLSPFTVEKTASFTVTPSKKIFYCFSAGFGGDVIDFISRIEQCSQIDAAKKLVEWYHIELPEEQKYVFHLPKHDESKLFFIINQHFAEWCHSQLIYYHDIMSYLQERITDNTIFTKFLIGYCPLNIHNNVQNYIDYMLKHNILIGDLIKTGVIIKSKTTDRYLFTFENRIIFPIHNIHSMICGFGARIPNDNDNRPKYINSHASAEFSKKDLLFGIHQAFPTIQKTKHVYVVEGYFDVINMYQMGYYNTVATMGTACTDHQVSSLGKLADTLTLIYDGDNAGKKAILKFITLCFTHLIDCYIIRLPESKDPGNLTKKELAELEKNKVHAINYFINQKTYNINECTSSEKISIINALIESFSAINDPLKLGVITKTISEKTGINQLFINQAITEKQNKGTQVKIHNVVEPVKTVSNERKKNNNDVTYEDDWLGVVMLTITNYDDLNRDLLFKIGKFIEYAPDFISQLWFSFVKFHDEQINNYKKNTHFIGFFDIIEYELKQRCLKLTTNCYLVSNNELENMYRAMKKKVWSYHIQCIVQQKKDLQSLTNLKLLFV